MDPRVGGALELRPLVVWLRELSLYAAGIPVPRNRLAGEPVRPR